MKRTILLICLSLLCIQGIVAQINLYPLATGSLCDRNQAAAGVLETKLKNVISRAGLNASNVEGRFVLAAKVEELQRELTQTAPQQHVMVLLVSFAVGDGYTGTCFDSTSTEVKGVGSTEERALLNAIKNIKPNSPEIAALCTSAKDKIIEYYDQNGPSIINKAKGLISSHQWDEACAELYAIPPESKYYDQAVDLMSQAVTSYSNYNSAQVVSQAEALWAANPTAENAEAVMQLLSNVDTDSPAYEQAQKLKTKVEKKINFLAAQERQDRIDSEMRANKLESQRIAEEGKTRRAVAKAAAQVASAYYNSHRVTYHVHSWW